MADAIVAWSFVLAAFCVVVLLDCAQGIIFQREFFIRFRMMKWTSIVFFAIGAVLMIVNRLL